MPISKIKAYTSLYTEGEHTAVNRLKLLKDQQHSIQNQLKIIHETNEMLEWKIALYEKMLFKK